MDTKAALVLLALAAVCSCYQRIRHEHGQCVNRYAHTRRSRIRGDMLMLAKDNLVWVYQVTCGSGHRPRLANIVRTWRAIVGYNPSLAYFNGRVVVFKGHHWSNYPRNVGVAELRRYLRPNASLVDVQPLAHSRQHPANGAVPVAGGYMVACGDGGESKGSHTCELLNEMSLNGRQGSRTLDCPLPGLWSASTVDQLGRVVVTGGWYWWGDKRGKGAAALDTATMSWSALPDMSTARHRHASALFNGDLVVCGGLENAEPLSSCERLPPNGTAWLPMRPMPARRFEFGLAALDGYLWAVGGKAKRDDYKAEGTVFYYDGRIWHRAGELGHVVRDTYVGGISAFGMAVIPAW